MLLKDAFSGHPYSRESPKVRGMLKKLFFQGDLRNTCARVPGKIWETGRSPGPSVNLRAGVLAGG